MEKQSNNSSEESITTIRTALLSKRWKKQWRHVPVLIFDYSTRNDCIIKHLTEIDRVLDQRECSKVEKFCISAFLWNGQDLHLDHEIKVAISRDVEELVLEFDVYYEWGLVRLPEFLFSHTLLVKLHLCGSTLPEFNDKVNMKHLKELKAVKCRIPETTIGNILSGSLSLDSIYMKYCKFHHLVIASKSLRKLALIRLTGSYIGISCAKLEELYLVGMYGYIYNSDNDINAVSDRVRFTTQGEFVINSESLKKLVLKLLEIYDLEISCPMLKELELLNGLYIRTANVVNLPSVVYAALNFHTKCVSKEILLQLQHIKELTFGRTFIKSLSHSQGKVIEDVVAARFFSGSLSNLKIAQIRGLSEIDDCCRHVIDYVEFLLKNARVLEKLTIFIEDISKDFVSEVSQKLLSILMCSQHAKVELWCLDGQLWVEEVKSMDSTEVIRPRGKIVNPIEVIKLIG